MGHQFGDEEKTGGGRNVVRPKDNKNNMGGAINNEKFLRKNRSIMDTYTEKAEIIRTHEGRMTCRI